MWNNAQKVPSSEFWKKYITVYEMVSLDNSLFQVKAAVEDFDDLFGRAARLAIPSSWLATMLTVGFNSKANGIARVLCETVLDLRPRSLAWMKEEILKPFNSANFFLGKRSFLSRICFQKCDEN